KACASANQAITSAADMIFRGYADTVIAGGAESLSDIPILFSKNFSEALVGASKQKSVGGKLGQFRKVKLKDLAPDAPAIGESTLEAMAKLRPVFDRKYGTITAANSSPLTDGAAAVLLMSEDKAKELGIKPIGFIRSYAYAATDPFEQLLQGPVFALPTALERAKISLKDIGAIEM